MRIGGYTSDASTSFATEDDDDGDLSDASASMETMDPKRRLIEAIRAWN